MLYSELQPSVGVTDGYEPQGFQVWMPSACVGVSLLSLAIRFRGTESSSVGCFKKRLDRY